VGAGSDSKDEEDTPDFDDKNLHGPLHISLSHDQKRGRTNQSQVRTMELNHAQIMHRWGFKQAFEHVSVWKGCCNDFAGVSLCGVKMSD
jgi:hypothetical protein